jgi:hypothetical protein
MAVIYIYKYPACLVSKRPIFSNFLGPQLFLNTKFSKTTELCSCLGLKN